WRARARAPAEARGARRGITGRAVECETASRAAANLQLLQADPRRRSVLAAGGRLYWRPFGSAVQPPHLPRVLRHDLCGARRNVAGQDAAEQNQLATCYCGEGLSATAFTICRASGR